MRYLIFIFILSMVSCKPEYTSEEIITQSINHSNLNQIIKSKISFDFRKNNYTAIRNNGIYKLERTVIKDSIKTTDILSNNGFQRFINDSLITLSEKDKNRFGNSVNSVHYFSILPLGLNDKATNKKLLESVVIKGKEHYKVQVTFNEEGGGDDFDDVFIYWFLKENFKLNYIAYKYHTNGGGVRFRDVKKEHFINGIRFVDYNNYKALDKNIDFYAIDKLYEEGRLKKISEIILDNIEVK